MYVCVRRCVGGLFIYFLSKIPETVSKTKDMGLSVVRRGVGCEPNTCSRHEEAVWKEPKGSTHTHNLVPPQPEVTINADSLVLTPTLEATKVKGALCER